VHVNAVALTNAGHVIRSQLSGVVKLQQEWTRRTSVTRAGTARGGVGGGEGSCIQWCSADQHDTLSGSNWGEQGKGGSMSRQPKRARISQRGAGRG
jgi:hypothetical protein